MPIAQKKVDQYQQVDYQFSTAHFLDELSQNNGRCVAKRIEKNIAALQAMTELKDIDLNETSFPYFPNFTLNIVNF